MAVRAVLDRYGSARYVVRPGNGAAVTHKVLLPGVTILERHVARIRTRVQEGFRSGSSQFSLIIRSYIVIVRR